jgi:uncharacterized protein YaiE (UPF0345 family)
MKFENVTAEAQANIYFDGKIVSHKVTLADQTTKTLGVMFAGDYHLDTELAERMDITDGNCTVTLDGSEESNSYTAGEHFDVPANSGFNIKVDPICQYVCSYID